jgi:hypothetical protein
MSAHDRRLCALRVVLALLPLQSSSALDCVAWVSGCTGARNGIDTSHAAQGAGTAGVALTTLSFDPRIVHIQALVSASERQGLLQSARSTVGVLNDDTATVGIKDRIARHLHMPLENMGPLVVGSRSEAPAPKLGPAQPAARSSAAFQLSRAD